MINKKIIKFLISLILLYFSIVSGQSTKPISEITLLFMGDIMGHDTQIHSAYDTESNSYNYNSCFKYVYPLINQADIAIANLEVTLGGKPYKGYPSFSSPNALAYACKNAGIDVLMIANNHCYDRGNQGFERTIKVLDSLNIYHTGTFVDQKDKKTNYPLILDNKGIRLVFLNYTYGTNSIVVQKPNVVNYIQRDLIKHDIDIAHNRGADIVIIYFHWGTEYQSNPDSSQISLYKFCVLQGADMIIGSHPHVIQRIEWYKNKRKFNLVAYSLGNFISNQRPRKRDGGLMLSVTVTKNKNKTRIKDAGYYLTWVYAPVLYGKKEFYIMPVSQYEKKADFFIKSAFEKMKIFAADSRELLKQQNINVNEYLYNTDTDKWMLKKNKESINTKR